VTVAGAARYDVAVTWLPTITPPERTYTVPAEARMTVVAGEARTVTTPADPRRPVIPAEDRTVTVPAEPRLIDA